MIGILASNLTSEGSNGPAHPTQERRQKNVRILFSLKHIYQKSQSKYAVDPLPGAAPKAALGSLLRSFMSPPAFTFLHLQS
jgi:hypothetical protein